MTGRAAVAALAVAAISGACTVGPGGAATSSPAVGPAPPVREVARVHLVADAPPPPAWTLPVPTTAVERRALRAPHHDYPAADLMVPTGTPVFAAHGGRARVSFGPRCGHGVAVAGPGGFRSMSCHLSVVSVVDGALVEPGDVLGLSGDSGNARGVPHLHFHVRDSSGRLVCPQGALVAWHAGRDVAPDAAEWFGGCTFPRDGRPPR